MTRCKMCLERVVAEAREHHAVVRDRSDAGGARARLALGVRILQADLVPARLAVPRLVPEPCGALFHHAGVAGASAARTLIGAAAVDVQRIAVAVGRYGAGSGSTVIRLRAFLLFAREYVNVQRR